MKTKPLYYSESKFPSDEELDRQIEAAFKSPNVILKEKIVLLEENLKLKKEMVDVIYDLFPEVKPHLIKLSEDNANSKAERTLAMEQIENGR